MTMECKLQDAEVQQRVAAISNEILRVVSETASLPDFVEERPADSEALAYFLIRSARHNRYVTVDGKKLFRSLVAGAWAASSGAFGDPFSAALGIVWALAELDALKADVHLVQGDRARVLSTIYRLSADDETATVSTMATKLDLGEETVREHAEWLCKADIVREVDGDYFVGQWRVEVLNAQQSTADAEDAEGNGNTKNDDHEHQVEPPEIPS